MDRQKIILRTSLVGILANLLLAGFKAAVGLLSNSIAILLDAVNNLSDVLSSVVTIIGTKLSSKPADKKHPLGHGRVEHLSAMLIGMIVLYAGITAMIEAVKKMIDPVVPDYTAVTLTVVGAAVLVKIFLSILFLKNGRKAKSDALIASGKDAMTDVAISSSVLAAAVAFLIWGVSLEAYLGAVISLFIIKAGVDVLRGTISQLLGERIDSHLSRAIKEELCSYEGVSGAFDLILHNYGPDRLVGSVHIEVSESITAPELDALERRLAADIYAKYNVILTGISIYSVNLSDPETDELFHAIHDEVMDYEHVLQIHGFHLDKATRTVTFDLIIGFEIKDRSALLAEIVEKLRQKYPHYTFFVTLDSDISD